MSDINIEYKFNPDRIKRYKELNRNDNIDVLKRVITTPTLLSTNLVFTGNALTPEFNNYDPNKIIMSGDTSAINAGEYTVIFTPMDKYCWNDGTNDSKDITWSINRQKIDHPQLSSTNLVYTGGLLTPIWINYDPIKMTMSNGISGIDADTYTATFTPTANYCWTDGSIIPFSQNWTIYKQHITNIPTTNSNLTYDGNNKTPVWNDYDTTKLTISGDTSAINAGDYTVIFTPTTNYCWTDGSISSKTVNWSINKQNITTPTLLSTNLVFTGNALTPEFNNYDPNKIIMSGDTSAINAGEYTVIFTPTTNYCWTDGSISSKTVNWKIDLANVDITVIYDNPVQYGTKLSDIPISAIATYNGNPVHGTIEWTTTNDEFDDLIDNSISRIPIEKVPTMSNTLTYDGSIKTPTWNDYNSNELIIGGTIYSINAGEYTTTFTPMDKYCWNDGTNDSKKIIWTINRKQIPIIPSPIVSNIEYNGTTQSPIWNNYDPKELILNITPQSNIGTYTATFTPTTNYCWTDGSINSKDVTWSIITSIIKIVPSPSKQMYTYNNISVSQTWNDYNSNELIIGGTYSGNVIGTYTATFTPRSGYTWSDGSTNTKNVNWSIKGPVNLELSINNYHLNPTWDSDNKCNKLTTLNVPEIFTGTDGIIYRVIGVKDGFSGYYMPNVTILTLPDSIEYIIYGFHDFKKLKTINWGKGLKRIGYQAFYECPSLLTVNIPEGVTFIGEKAFACIFEISNLTTVKFPSTLIDIAPRAFENCKKLTTAIIPNSVTSIGMDAFIDCSNLTNIGWTIVPNNITQYGYYYNDENGKYNDICGDAVNNHYDNQHCLVNNPFALCPLLPLISLSNKEWYDQYSINGTYRGIIGGLYSYVRNLRKVIIPEGSPKLQHSALRGCRELEEVVIPKSLTEIGIQAFVATDNLKTIYYRGTEEEWNRIKIEYGSFSIGEYDDSNYKEYTLTDEDCPVTVVFNHNDQYDNYIY